MHGYIAPDKSHPAATIQGVWLRLDAFNLWNGAVFQTGDTKTTPEHYVDAPAGSNETWVVVNVVRRDADHETITVLARRCDIDTFYVFESFTFDYTVGICIIGNIVNYDDLDDNNFG